MSRFGWYSAFTSVVLFAALGWALCHDPGFAEYERLCIESKTKILRKIPHIASYVDATGNGCSWECMQNLKNKVVEFVEINFDRQKYLIEKERNHNVFDTGLPLPQKDGLYKVRIKTEEPPCAHLYDAELPRDKVLDEYCLGFESVPRHVSRHEYKATSVSTYYSMGHLGGRLVQYRDLQSGEIIASRGHFGYQGTAMRYMPFTYDVSCGDGSLHLSDVME